MKTILKMYFHFIEQWRTKIFLNNAQCYMKKIRTMWNCLRCRPYVPLNEFRKYELKYELKWKGSDGVTLKVHFSVYFSHHHRVFTYVIKKKRIAFFGGRGGGDVKSNCSSLGHNSYTHVNEIEWRYGIHTVGMLMLFISNDCVNESLITLFQQFGIPSCWTFLFNSGTTISSKYNDAYDLKTVRYNMITYVNLTPPPRNMASQKFLIFKIRTGVVRHRNLAAKVLDVQTAHFRQNRRLNF